MDKFTYKKASGITLLSANMTEFSYKRHAHEEYAVGVTLSGIQQYHSNSMLNSSYHSGVMLFNNEQAHDGFAADKRGISYIMLYIPTDLFSEISESKEIFKFSSPIVYDKRLAGSILRLADNITQDGDDFLSTELLMDVVKNVSLNNHDYPIKPDTMVNRAMEMIRDNLGVNIRLDNICKELMVSKYHFIRMFKASMGISPYQFYLSCKLEHARHLLETEMDVYSVMTECGFFDLAHLNRHFKGAYGITALEYHYCIFGKQAG